MTGTVAASRLAVHIGGVRVLEDVTLALESGKLTCIVGPNGAGKTTLLRCLAGEVRPEEGRVTIGDIAPADLPAPERAQTRAFLAQAERTDVPYAVRTVVGFGTHASQLDGDDPDDRVRQAMQALEVDAVADRRLSSLSGGERKRAAIARTFAQQAEVMLLDEPTDSLDLAHADLIMRLCIEYSRPSRNVVVSSHDLNLAARHADRVIVLDRGRVAADGSPSEVFTEELLSNVYRCEVRVMEHPDDGGPLVYL